MLKPAFNLSGLTRIGFILLGVTVLLVEQNARAALKLAHRGYVMEARRVVLEDSAERLLANPEVAHAYLGGRK